MDSFALKSSELLTAVECVSAMFTQGCFAIGTAYIDPDMDKCERGRLLFLAVTNERKFELLHQLQLRGDISALKLMSPSTVDDKYRLVIGIKGRVH